MSESEESSLDDIEPCKSEPDDGRSDQLSEHEEHTASENGSLEPFFPIPIAFENAESSYNEATNSSGVEMVSPPASNDTAEPQAPPPAKPPTTPQRWRPSWLTRGLTR